MDDNIQDEGPLEKRSVSQGDEGATGDGAVVLLPCAPVPPEIRAALQHLARAHVVPEAVLAALDGPLGGAIATAAEYAGSALSDATKRAYGRDWFAFADWCRQQAVDPAVLPIHPMLVAAYLASLAGRLGRSALNGRVAAIAHEHRRRGPPWDARHPVIRDTLQDIGRTHGKPVRRAAALTSVEIKRLVAACADDTAGLRDRALFLVGFAGALRRSELVAIDHAHLRFEASHVTIRIPRFKGDQTGKGADIALPRLRDATGGVSETCPVQALERWLARARIRRGAVFRSVTAGGRLGDRLSPDGVRHILLSRAKLAKLTVPPGKCRWRRESAHIRRGRSVAASERNHGDVAVGVMGARH